MRFSIYGEIPAPPCGEWGPERSIFENLCALRVSFSIIEYLLYSYAVDPSFLEYLKLEQNLQYFQLLYPKISINNLLRFNTILLNYSIKYSTKVGYL